jgi:hypothetical protein
MSDIHIWERTARPYKLKADLTTLKLSRIGNCGYRAYLGSSAYMGLESQSSSPRPVTKLAR